MTPTNEELAELLKLTLDFITSKDKFMPVTPQQQAIIAWLYGDRGEKCEELPFLPF